MRALHLLIPPVLCLAACQPTATTGGPGDGVDEPTDGDGDGYVLDEDCDDGNSAMNPGATEVCDGLDNDCNGTIDDDASDAATWYADGDGDGFGGDQATAACSMPAGYAAETGDCDDTDPAFHPGADEDDCTDPNDYNCDGSVGYADADEDGYPACEDCDDDDAARNPGATEVCNGVDDDCDRATDTDAVDIQAWYEDDDGDGYGDPAAVSVDCDQPPGSVSDATDCNDGNAAVHPGADESDCTDPTDYNCDGSVGYADADADGFAACEDCDDTDALVNPWAAEICDAADNDCDSAVDEDAIDATTWYADEDGDTFGDADAAVVSCDAPLGAVSDSTDCDDTSAASNPSASEVCDGADNDCDGEIDEDSADAATWYYDADGDGYGDDATVTTSCTAPLGYVAVGGDCNDANTDINPGATEDDCADPTDYNCDGSVGYADADGDGYPACEDCDDGNADAHPGGVETCDGADNDCDEETDEDATDAGTWYFDGDGDGAGDPASTLDACTMPSGYAVSGEDCDDEDSASFPGGTEVCDSADNDCNGSVDDGATDAPTWYLDGDADGYGDDLSTLAACEQPGGYAGAGGDCDDSDAAFHPGATEDDCTDPNDYNCDGSAGFADADGDGYAACEDCDDLDSRIHPGGTEVCDGVDNDCNDLVDDAATDATTFYVDADGDGHGDPAATADACSMPTGYAATGDDCDDADAARFPGNPEICDDADNDCDADVDEDAADALTWFADDDGDGFGDSLASTIACDAPARTVLDATDCDDDASAVNPGAVEVCDAIDNDCDTFIDEASATDASTWYADADGDGYGDASVAVSACTAPEGYVALAGDCDDLDPGANPGMLEVCGGGDEDCDGLTDEDDSSDAPTWYADADGDGYGDGDVFATACATPAGAVDDASDCDDGNADINPGAAEVCNGADDDCDGDADEDFSGPPTTWYTDADNDGFGDPGTAVVACDPPADGALLADDCDDADAAINPDADESCNGVDDDCDDAIDEDDAVDAPTWYADADGDSYGDASISTVACSAPTEFVSDATDCDDSQPAVNPAATESCNGIDDDCDEAIDEAGSTGETTWYADADGDSYGDAARSVSSCGAPDGYVSDASDCDDGSADFNPAAGESCGDPDYNCNGLVGDDDPATTGQATWYADDDGDTYGDPADALDRCDAPEGYVGNASDCDDANALVNPTANEVCDPLDTDENCNGVADDDDPSTDPSTLSTFFADADLDGYGDPASSIAACDLPAGYEPDSDDCDDTDPDTYAGAPEICEDYADNGCDGVDDCRVADAFLVAEADVMYLGVAGTAGSLGSGIAGGKDVDGDGYPDILVADRAFDTTTANVGRVYLLGGSESGPPSALSGALGTWTDTSAGDALGQGVALLDDTDGDGMAEVLIGVYLDNTGQTDGGLALLFRGDDAPGFARTPANAYVTITDASTNTSGQEYTGWLVAPAGDVDGDTVPDWMVGSPGYDQSSTSNVGRLTLFSGELATGTYDVNASNLGSIRGTSATEVLGFSACGECDADGDGTTDILVGSMSTDSVYVFLGPNDSAVTRASADYTISGVAFNGTSVNSAAAVVGVGDHDGDGYEDFGFGADGDSTDVSLAGAGYLLRGPIEGSLVLTDAYEVAVRGVVASDFCGRNVGAAGDVDGDGRADFLVGCTGYDYTSSITGSGIAALLYGPASGDYEVTSADITVQDSVGSAATGASVAGVGDVDGDGFGDFMIGASGYKSAHSSSGTVYGAAAFFYGTGQ
jgi:hypothetical protein